MKKKLLTAVLSAVLCLGMSVTAFAAPSPTKNQPTGTIATTKSYSEASESWTSAEKEAAAAIQNAASPRRAVRELAASAGVTINPDVVKVIDVTAATTGWTSFKVSGAVRGQKVVVFHYQNGAWVQLTDAVVEADGWVSATFTSFSPTVVGLESHYHYWQEYTVAPTATTWGYTMHYCNECGEQYADNYVAPGTSAAVAAGGSAAVTSPKTAESSLPVVLLFAAVGACGVVVCAKRKAES